jgi:hypothetical protein
MGNKCPSGFQNNPANAVLCVRECPRQQGFELQIRNGVPACVYKSRPDVSFTLATASAFTDQEIAKYPTINLIPPNVPAKLQYVAADEKFKADLAIASQKVNKEAQLADAFKDLQLAENVRDKSPQAYQDARIRYYTLLNGDKWIEEERQRVVASEVVPKVASYMSSYQDLTNRQNQQQRTMDVVKAVKDKVISMKDDFKMTTNVFGKQIQELKSQIEIERRKGAEQKEEIQSWIHYLVNTLLVVFAIAAIITIVRKLMAKNSTPIKTPITIRT